ncbi:MAG: hypothetical protein KC561_07545, partial [Myxococcales bacterium]|nr:hypothetical protein [Myxococcales bacterium]
MKNLCILLMAVAFVLLDLSGCGAAQSAVESIGSLFDGGDDDEPAQEEEQNGENGDETQNAQAQQ